MAVEIAYEGDQRVESAYNSFKAGLTNMFENYASKIKKHMNTMYHQIEHQQRHGHYYK